MHKSMKWLLLGSVVMLAACSTPTVRYDYDAKVNMSGYHTVVVEGVTSDVRDGGEAFKNPLNEQRLRDAVSDQLDKHGIKPAADGEQADSYVTIAVGSRRNGGPDGRSNVRVGFGFGTWRPGFGSSVYVTDDPWVYYREGRISVDLFDAKTKKPLWHASVESDLSYMTRDDAAQRINKLVEAMFVKFPGSTTTP
jgi:hypothetical protein